MPGIFSATQYSAITVGFYLKTRSLMLHYLDKIAKFLVLGYLFVNATVFGCTCLTRFEIAIVYELIIILSLLFALITTVYAFANLLSLKCSQSCTRSKT